MEEVKYCRMLISYQSLLKSSAYILKQQFCTKGEGFFSIVESLSKNFPKVDQYLRAREKEISIANQKKILKLMISALWERVAQEMRPNGRDTAEIAQNDQNSSSLEQNGDAKGDDSGLFKTDLMEPKQSWLLKYTSNQAEGQLSVAFELRNKIEAQKSQIEDLIAVKQKIEERYFIEKTSKEELSSKVKNLTSKLKFSKRQNKHFCAILNQNGYKLDRISPQPKKEQTADNKEQLGSSESTENPENQKFLLFDLDKLKFIFSDYIRIQLIQSSFNCSNDTQADHENLLLCGSKALNLNRSMMSEIGFKKLGFDQIVSKASTRYGQFQQKEKFKESFEERIRSAIAMPTTISQASNSLKSRMVSRGLQVAIEDHKEQIFQDFTPEKDDEIAIMGNQFFELGNNASVLNFCLAPKNRLYLMTNETIFLVGLNGEFLESCKVPYDHYYSGPGSHYQGERFSDLVSGKSYTFLYNYCSNVLYSTKNGACYFTERIDYSANNYFRNQPFSSAKGMFLKHYQDNEFCLRRRKAYDSRSTLVCYAYNGVQMKKKIEKYLNFDVSSNQPKTTLD